MISSYQNLFASRIAKIQPSFIREILKAADNDDVISFAGGLPNQSYFPQEALRIAASKAISEQAGKVLQYGNSEGEPALRRYVCRLYQQRYQLDIGEDDVLITTGSQQGLDLLGKVLVNGGDNVIIEAPGYLGAIQSLSMYEANFLPITIASGGVDTGELANALGQSAKMFYCVPNFQNPTGYSYAADTKREVAALLKNKDCVIVEDDPYGEIRFSGEAVDSFSHWLPRQTVLLGSFSKIVSPGLRVGWVVAPPEIMEKLVIAKQACDLHTSRLTQHTIVNYVEDNDLAQHVATISKAYEQRCVLMGELLDQRLGDQIERSIPDGGMFMWLKLCDNLDSLKLFDVAAEEGVVFVPGEPFYTTEGTSCCLRLNFSCSSFKEIEIGVDRLCRAIGKMHRNQKK